MSNRISKLNDYIKKELDDLKPKNELISYIKEVDENFNDDVGYALSLPSNERISDYYSSLRIDNSIFSFFYLYYIYKKDIVYPYTFERFFYNDNISVILNFYSKQDDSFLSLSELGKILLTDFACDDFRVGHLCYEQIIKSIQSGKMARSLPMYTHPQKLGVLAIEMLASKKNQTIDWESAGIPIDPFYQRFCLEALYNENHDVVVQWLIALCDKHVEWSALFGINSDEQSSTGYEIDSIILLSWPFEYQAVKNFRARHGLTTPVIDHPLLKTPMAIEHRPDMVGWKQNMPSIYYQIIDDLITINPELQVIHKLF